MVEPSEERARRSRVQRRAGQIQVEVTRMAVVALRGEIDMAGLDDLRDAIEPHLAAGQKIILDLSGVSFADSTLINVLSQILGKAEEIGAGLVVRNPSNPVRKLLSLGDLDDLVQTEMDRQNDPR